MARLAAAADRLDYWIHTAPDCCPGVQITVGSAVGKLGLCLLLPLPFIPVQYRWNFDT
jgi:hypothetical protein